MAVAFSCRLSHDITSIDAGNNIKFNADVNVTSGYSNGTGIFTAPLTGHYLIAYNVSHRNTGNPLTVSLLLNGNTVSSAVAEKVAPGATSQSGNQTIVHMENGDTAQVVVKNPGAKQIVGGSDGFTSFCGFKLD